MFDLPFGAGASEADALDTRFVGETVAKIRSRLATDPGGEQVIQNLPALELMLAAHVKKHDSELLRLTTAALERANDSTSPGEVSNATLAELIFLNLRVCLLTRDTKFREHAQRAIATANTRWNEELAFFEPRAASGSKVFYTDANAGLGEAFYFAWRVLDEPSLRPKAGEILGQVSQMFVAEAGLGQCIELPEGAPKERNHLAAYASAIQMFLTASETMARRTYVARGCILAEYGLTHALHENAPLAARARFADALLRLEQFTSIRKYRSTAREIVQDAAALISTAEASLGDQAVVALALDHADYFPLRVIVLGDVVEDENAKGLWFTALDAASSARAIEVLDPTLNAARIEELGYALTGGTRAYVCAGPLCLPPVMTAERLKGQLQRVGSD